MRILDGRQTVQGQQLARDASVRLVRFVLPADVPAPGIRETMRLLEELAGRSVLMLRPSPTMELELLEATEPVRAALADEDRCSSCSAPLPGARPGEECYDCQLKTVGLRPGRDR